MRKDSSNIKSSKRDLKACSKCKKAFAADELVDVGDGFYCKDCISGTIKDRKGILKTDKEELIERREDGFNIKKQEVVNSRDIWIRIIFEYAIFLIIFISISIYSWDLRGYADTVLGAIEVGIALTYGLILRRRLESLGFDIKKIIVFAIILGIVTWVIFSAIYDIPLNPFYDIPNPHD